MQTNWKIFTAGFAISFIGALPLGSLNATAFQLAAEQSLKSAFTFALATTGVELIIVAFLATSIDFKVIFNKAGLRKWLGLSACVMLCILAAYNFNHAFAQSTADYTPDLTSRSAFTLGLILSATNPFQIPFWVGWNFHLRQKQLLTFEKINIITYIAGIGLATLSVMTLFILSGKMIHQHAIGYTKFISLFMGCLYILLAAYIFLKIYFIRIFPSHLSKRHV